MGDLITTAQIMDWEPCEEYPEARVRRLMGDGLAARAILGLDILAEDRLWVVLRNDLLPDRLFRLFACDCAERALERERAAGHEPDPRSWAAVAVARLYAAGNATDEELSVARSAAWFAIHSAAGSAAWSAVGSAAWGAACDAARSAAESVAGYTAWDVERDWQVTRLQELIDEEEVIL